MPSTRSARQAYKLSHQRPLVYVPFCYWVVVAADISSKFWFCPWRGFRIRRKFALFSIELDSRFRCSCPRNWARASAAIGVFYLWWFDVKSGVTNGHMIAKERGGSSRQALLKYIMNNYKLGNNEKGINAYLKIALMARVKNKTLKQSKGVGASGSFKLGNDKDVKVVKPELKTVEKAQTVCKQKTFVDCITDCCMEGDLSYFYFMKKNCFDLELISNCRFVGSRSLQSEGEACFFFTVRWQCAVSEICFIFE